MGCRIGVLTLILWNKKNEKKLLKNLDINPIFTKFATDLITNTKT